MVTNLALFLGDICAIIGNLFFGILSDTLLYQIPLKGITDAYPPVAFKYSTIYKFEDENACINDEFLVQILLLFLNHCY